MHPVPPLLDPLASVVAHSPAQTRAYLGSPSIVRLPDGSLVVSHDFFGPGSPHDEYAREYLTHVYRSADEGAHWERIAETPGAFWSSLFLHRGALYLLGCTAEYGDIAIRRSEDGGRTWTTPSDERTGLLFPGGPGNTSFDDADFDTIIRSIDELLFAKLPPDTLVLPGHGDDTTIGAERPHLQEWIDRGW